MNLSERVPNLKNICGIAIDLSAVPIPSYSTAGQPFYDSFLAQSNAQPVYYGKRNVKFLETSKENAAGTYWEISLEIQFPNNDNQRALRTAEFLKAKYVIIQLSGGSALLLGRNDFFQNAKPRVKIKNNEQITSVEFTTNSIIQLGFLPDYNSGMLPHSIPVNLLNAI